MKKAESLPLIQEGEGDTLPSKESCVIQTYLAPVHSYNLESVENTMNQRLGNAPTSIIAYKALNYCPYCNYPLIYSNFYFNMLHQLSQKQPVSFSECYFNDLGLIGSGSFGSVIRVCHHIQDIQLYDYAIKRIPIGQSKPWLLKALYEVQILQRLKHPNIIQYHHCWMEDIKTSINLEEPIPHLHILLDYAKGGSLANLRPSILGRQLTEREFAHLLKDAVLGLDHLHSMNFISRDVKLQNFLLTGSMYDEQPQEYIGVIFGSDARNEQLLRMRKQFRTDVTLYNRVRQWLFIRNCGILDLKVLLTDFGQVGNGVSAGTELLTAPEVFLRNKHSFESDVYSLGLSFMQLMVQEGEQDAIERGVSAYQKWLVQQFISNPWDLGPRTVQLITSMVDENPLRRPSCAEILRILGPEPPESGQKAIEIYSPDTLLKHQPPNVQGDGQPPNFASVPARALWQIGPGIRAYNAAISTISLLLLLYIVLAR